MSFRQPSSLFSSLVLLLFAGISIGSALPTSTHAAETPPVSWGSQACQSSENWGFSAEIPAEFQKIYKLYLTQQISPMQGFSEAIALRKKATSNEAKMFADYWISRSIFDTGLFHIAYNGLGSIVSQTSSPATAGIQFAALNCLILISESYPSMKLTDKSYALVHGLLTGQLTIGGPEAAANQTLSKATYQLVLQLIPQSLTQAESLVTALTTRKQSHPEAILSQALITLQQGKTAEIITHLVKYFSSARPAYLQNADDQYYLILARSYFKKGLYDRGINTLKLIPPGSNNFAQALTEIQWMAIQKPSYSEAIGPGISLQSGAMKRTFTPDAPIVMAMAMNELCQFPEAIRAIGLFRKEYEPSFNWLKKWKSTGTPLYGLVIQSIKGASPVPVKVANEWIRSPLFLARQDEINLLYKEKASMSSQGKRAAEDVKKTARELAKRSRAMRKQYENLKESEKQGAELPGYFKVDLEKLKTDIVHFNRFRNAAPLWQKVLSNYVTKSQARQAELISKINQDLKMVTQRIYANLNDMTETAQLIEVEIYNGATNDIIWQNANPEYKEVSRDLASDSSNQKDASTVWNWGNVVGGIDGTNEIWEDELNSFQAELPDNCTNKEKYLQIKKNVAMGK